MALAAKPFLCHWLRQCDSARAWHLDCSHRHGILDGGAIRSVEATGNLAYIENMTHPHRKQVRYYEQARHLHELTFSCDKRKPLLTNDVWRKILAAALTKACLEEQFRLIVFVFMPEHVHLLVLPENPQSKVNRLLARTKQPASKQIRELLEANDSDLVRQLTVQERPGKFCFRFWQEGHGFDRNLFSAEAVSSSIDYIHTNPVKRGLCRAAVDDK